MSWVRSQADDTQMWNNNLNNKSGNRTRYTLCGSHLPCHASHRAHRHKDYYYYSLFDFQEKRLEHLGFNSQVKLNHCLGKSSITKCLHLRIKELIVSYFVPKYSHFRLITHYWGFTFKPFILLSKIKKCLKNKWMYVGLVVIRKTLPKAN